MSRLVAVGNPVHEAEDVKHPKIGENDDPDDEQAKENGKSFHEKIETP